VLTRLIYMLDVIIVMTIQPSDAAVPVRKDFEYVLSGCYAIFLRSKDKFAKASQYLALLVCWVYER